MKFGLTYPWRVGWGATAGRCSRRRRSRFCCRPPRFRPSSSGRRGCTFSQYPGRCSFSGWTFWWPTVCAYRPCVYARKLRDCVSSISYDFPSWRRGFWRGFRCRPGWCSLGSWSRGSRSRSRWCCPLQWGTVPCGKGCRPCSSGSPGPCPGRSSELCVRKTSLDAFLVERVKKFRDLCFWKKVSRFFVWALGWYKLFSESRTTNFNLKNFAGSLPSATPDLMYTLILWRRVRSSARWSASELASRARLTRSFRSSRSTFFMEGGKL